jgi:hypothetical protein
VAHADRPADGADVIGVGWPLCHADLVPAVAGSDGIGRGLTGRQSEAPGPRPYASISSRVDRGQEDGGVRLDISHFTDKSYAIHTY